MADLEKLLREQVDAAEAWRHVERLSTIVRTAGTPEEKEAVDYFMARLAEYGVPAQLHQFEAFVSHPLEAELEILEPEHAFIPCRPGAFAASTPEGGIEAEVVYQSSAADRGSKEGMIFDRQAGKSDEYSGESIAGKIVITASGGPDGVKHAQDAGAVAHCHVWPSDEDVIHERITTSIWGTPTPESIGRLPKIPAIDLKKRDGERLKALCQRGTVRARLKTRVFIGWRTVLLPVATIEGRVEPEKFLLVGGHHCSWFVGTTDNATGNGCMLEMARVLHLNRDKLRRSVRIAWWPAHSHGRYAGSTWYADNAFDDLRRSCIAYLNIDSPGVRGATLWDCFFNHAEVEQFMDRVMLDVTGRKQEIRRPFKAGDQSFSGIGMPSLGASPMIPVDSPDRAVVGGSGNGYWWHSPEDTLDKGDPERLAFDTGLYLAVAARLCTAELLPFEFVTAAKDFERLVGNLKEAAGSHLDLSPLLTSTERFEAAAWRLESAKGGAAGPKANILNEGLMRISRILSPVLYTVAGDYEQDPALQAPMLPGLDPARKLARMDPAGSEYRLLRTWLVRQRNRTEDALYRATAEVNRVLAELK